MKIRERVRDWPPHVTGGFGNAVSVDLDDAVVSAQRAEGADDHIIVRLRKKDRTEYTVALVLTEDLHGKAILTILEKDNRTLRDIGELDI